MLFRKKIRETHIEIRDRERERERAKVSECEFFSFERERESGDFYFYFFGSLSVFRIIRFRFSQDFMRFWYLRILRVGIICFCFVLCYYFYFLFFIAAIITYLISKMITEEKTFSFHFSPTFFLEKLWFFFFFPSLCLSVSLSSQI